jgi:hypothetical protein
MNKKLLLLVCAFLLVSCQVRTNVDDAAPSFVDDNAAPTVDTGVPPPTDEEQPAPPVNVTENATITLDEKKSFIGRDVVKLWVWNERGSQSLLMAEGTGASIPELKISIQASAIGHEGTGEVKFFLNGKPLRTLNEDEEACLDGTCVFVTDFFLNADQQ